MICPSPLCSLCFKKQENPCGHFLLLSSFPTNLWLGLTMRGVDFIFLVSSSVNPVSGHQFDSPRWVAAWWLEEEALLSTP